MNELKLNDVLQLTEDVVKNSKIELNMWAGQRGKSFLNVWLASSDTDKEDGTCKCSYWSTYGKAKNFYKGQTVFSFVRLRGDDWLFVSAGKILSVPSNAFADVEIIEKYKALFGRLIISCKKGNTFARYTFNLKKYLGHIVVKEILPCMYSGEHFDGYDKVNLSYDKLKDIFSGKALPSFKEALEKVTGVYCLTDTKTGKLYIGSATGEGGVAQRWGNYLDTKHGGNKKLIELYKEKGDEYFEQYFTFTLIEYFTLSYDPDKVLEREQYWKRCFDTIRHGYNDN